MLSLLFHFSWSAERMIRDQRSTTTELKFMIRMKVRSTINQDCEFSLKIHLCIYRREIVTKKKTLYRKNKSKCMLG